MAYLTAEESSASKILQFLEYFASKGFENLRSPSLPALDRGVSASIAHGKLLTMMTWRRWRERWYFTPGCFPNELRRTLTAIS